jgi:hypothetical protein
MKRIIAILFIFITCLILISCGIFQKEIIIPGSRLQEIVDKKFPYDINIIFARLILDSPLIYFQVKNIGMKLNYRGQIMGNVISGSIDFKGLVIYKPEKGAFFINDFDIVDLTINNGNLADKEKIINAVSSILNNYLNDLPVYQLENKDSIWSLTKLRLKGVDVKGENLVLTLGICN